jgi:hypothetical protein
MITVPCVLKGHFQIKDDRDVDGKKFSVFYATIHFLIYLGHFETQDGAVNFVENLIKEIKRNQ